MPCYFRPLSSSGKLRPTCAKGQTLGREFQRPSTDESTLIGTANEVSVEVNGVGVKALIDTGSTVSTISRSFCKEQFPDIEIKSLDTVIPIECADGQLLPYDGYVELHLKVPGIRNVSSAVNKGLFLIVPESNYSCNVPILIGTNILTVLMERVKENYGINATFCSLQICTLLCT